MPANVYTYIMYSYICRYMYNFRSLAAGIATVPTPTQHLELARLVYTVHCIYYIYIYTQENRSPSPIIPCTTLQPSAAATSNIHADDIIITDPASSRGDVRRIPLGNGYLFVNSTSTVFSGVLLQPLPCTRKQGPRSGKGRTQDVRSQQPSSLLVCRSCDVYVHIRYTYTEFSSPVQPHLPPLLEVRFPELTGTRYGNELFAHITYASCSINRTSRSIFSHDVIRRRLYFTTAGVCCVSSVKRAKIERSLIYKQFSPTLPSP